MGETSWRVQYGSLLHERSITRRKYKMKKVQHEKPVIQEKCKKEWILEKRTRIVRFSDKRITQNPLTDCCSSLLKGTLM